MTIDDDTIDPDATDPSDADAALAEARAEVKRVKASLAKERKAHGATKALYEPWRDMDHDEVVAGQDRLAALEASGAGGPQDEAKFNDAVAAQVAAKVKPVERERDKWRDKFDSSEAENADHRAKNTDRQIRKALRAAAFDENGEPTIARSVIDSGDLDALAPLFEIQDDGEVVTRDGGQTPAEFVPAARDARPHWQLTSQGGGAQGASRSTAISNNPFSDDNYDRAAQGRMITEKGEAYAIARAKEVGATLSLSPADVKAAKEAGRPVYED